MIKRFAPVLAIVAAALASAALPAAAQVQGAPQARATDDWLHPKLGMVKVDRATGAMVHARRADTQDPKGVAVSGPARPGLGHDASQRAAKPQDRDPS